VVVHLDLAYVMFVGQGHGPKFKVTEGNVPVSAESETVKMAMPVSATWRKSKPEFEAINN